MVFDQLDNYLSQRSRPALMVAALLMLAVIWLVDWLSGPYLATSVFYLLPVGLVAWYVSRRSGVLLSALGATAWFAIDQLTNPVQVHPIIPYWNATVRLGFFLIATFALSSLRRVRVRHEELVQYIVHDLRAPLSNMTTGLSLLEEMTGATADQQTKEVLEICTSSGTNMAALIDNLLDVARLESRRMPLQPEQIEPSELVAETLEQLSLLARRATVALELDLPPGLPAVRADRALTGRVLMNLVSNAIRFSPPGSTVKIALAPKGGSAVQFKVTDQGPGVPKQWQRAVFEKFTQVQARKAGAAVGTGLGLTFCRLAVKAQGGRIWLDGQRGQGTTVTFTLPVATPAKGAADDGRS